MDDLTHRERQLLRQQLKHERVCVGKYKEYAGRAGAGLGQLLSNIAADEEKHCRMIEGLLTSSGQESGTKSTPVDSFGRQVEPTRQSTTADITSPSMLFKRWRGQEPERNPPLRRRSHTAETETSYNGGPLSIPSVKMETAEEWDGVDLSPWANLTSPSPLDNDEDWAKESSLGAIDRSMLVDAMMTERFLSGAYDAAVFDSENPAIRRVFQEIQQDEQRHGQQIGEFMKKRG